VTRKTGTPARARPRSSRTCPANRSVGMIQTSCVAPASDTSLGVAIACPRSDVHVSTPEPVAVTMVNVAQPDASVRARVEPPACCRPTSAPSTASRVCESRTRTTMLDSVLAHSTPEARPSATTGSAGRPTLSDDAGDPGSGCATTRGNVGVAGLIAAHTTQAAASARTEPSVVLLAMRISTDSPQIRGSRSLTLLRVRKQPPFLLHSVGRSLTPHRAGSSR